MVRIKTSPAEVWREYLEGVAFNNALGLYDTVEKNNDFYNDRQWEGVNAPNLDKPMINIIKPAVNYYIAQLVSDDIGINLECKGLPEEQGDYVSKIAVSELENVLESTDAAFKHRQLLRNMAVDGDMVLYSYFDNGLDVGNGHKGGICTEIIYNTDIYFGNPIESDIQKQPYVIIKQRRLLSGVLAEVEANGESPDGIVPDSDCHSVDKDTAKQYVTVLIKFWREGGTIRYTKVSQGAVIKQATDLEYTLYPIAYASWEPVKNSYHGVSPVSGKISNQIAINKIYAMATLHTQGMAFPKVLYDRTKLPQGWSNDPAKAIAVNGNPQEAIFSTFKPADMSNQVQGLIKQLITDTKDSMGVYDAALGNVRPDNTSAIIATQKAASAPLDLQRLDFYQFVEDCVRIWLDIMIADYGIRDVEIETEVTPEVPMPMPGKAVTIPTQFNFAELKAIKYKLSVDIGASSYWSELMQVQTMDNLMKMKIIPDNITYLENIPDSYIKGKAKIMHKLQEQQKQQQQQAMAQQAAKLGASQMGASQMGGEVMNNVMPGM